MTWYFSLLRLQFPLDLIRMQIWNAVLWTVADTNMSCSPTDIFMTSFCDFLFHQIKLVSKPLWKKDGKWHIVGSTVTQETIAFFHIGKPPRSYKCHLQQRQYVLQYKAKSKDSPKEVLFFNWYMLEPLSSALTILFCLPHNVFKHNSNFIESPLPLPKSKYFQDLWTGTDLSECHVDIYTPLSVK